MSRLSQFLSVAILAATLLLSRLTLEAWQTPGLPAPNSRLAGFPQIVLWAWERPEDLSFIDPRVVGIAFLAKTLYLRGEEVAVRPRLQPVQVPTRTALMAVTRIESDLFKPPAFSPVQRAKVVSAIEQLTHIPAIAAIQVDFDARASERAFYRDLLSDLRRQLPSTIGLSITALASWCFYDNWLSGLPVDEVVPMLFRMGVDRQQIVFHLNAGADFRPALCRQSVGVSTDEPRPRLPAGRRVYIFHPRSWSQEAVHGILQEVRRWQ